MTLICRFMDSPVGQLKLVARGNRLVAILGKTTVLVAFASGLRPKPLPVTSSSAPNSS